MNLKTIAFVGDCQAQKLAQIYQLYFAPLFDQRAIHVLSIDPKVNRLQLPPEQKSRLLRQADMVVAQLFDFPIEISKSDLSPGAEVCLFPTTTGAFLWPYGREAHPKNTPIASLPGGPFSVENGDRFLNRMLAEKLPSTEAIPRYLDLDIARTANLDRLFEVFIEKQRIRDKLSGITVADYIVSHLKDEILFLTPYHPGLGVFKHIAAQVFGKLGVPVSDIERAMNLLRVSPFYPTSLPIHPGTAEHFGLPFAHKHHRFPFHRGDSFTFKEFITCYYNYDWNVELHEGIHFSSSSHDPAHTLSILEVGLTRSPDSVWGLRAKSLLLSRLGRLDESRETILRAIGLQPMEVGSHIDLIRIYLKMGDLGRAEEAALGAVALDPHHDRCKRALADVFAKVGRLADAVRLAREATQKAPGDAEGHAFLGHMCLQNDDLPGAEAAFRSALRLAPDSLESKIGYAEALLRQSRTAEIKSELECWLEEEQTNARLHAAFGKALSAEGDFEQARTSLLRAVQLEPTNVQYLASLAHVLRQMGKVAEAVTELRRALEIDPANGHLLAALGAALAHDGRLDEAELCFSRALNFDPLNVPWHRSLADTLLRLEKLVDAEKVICDALRLSPDDSQALHLRARLEMSLKAAAREPESVGPTSMAAFN